MADLDQGDWLAVAQRLADLVGIDYYPRHALVPVGSKTLYWIAVRSVWHTGTAQAVDRPDTSQGQKLMIAEGQAEALGNDDHTLQSGHQAMASCLPEHVIGNYNAGMGWFGQPRCMLTSLGGRILVMSGIRAGTEVPQA